MLRVSVVEVALAGLCIELDSVVVVVLWIVGAGASLTVVQALKEMNAVAAMAEMISVFIYFGVLVVTCQWLLLSLLTRCQSGQRGLFEQ